MNFYCFKAKFYDGYNDSEQMVNGIVFAKYYADAINKIIDIYSDRDLMCIYHLECIDTTQPCILFDDEMKEIIEKFENKD